MSFKSYVYSASLSRVAITETWLTNSILDSELLPSNYSLFCTDRSSPGDCLMLATHNSIPTKELSSTLDLEIVTVILELKIRIILFLVYISPHSNSFYFYICLPIWVSLSYLIIKSFPVVTSTFEISIGTCSQPHPFPQSPSVTWSTSSIYLSYPPPQPHPGKHPWPYSDQWYQLNLPYLHLQLQLTYSYSRPF